ncbi:MULTISPECIES: branched-chain amino acid ABC transporter permease [unclassified Oceanobacter]|uniref:branched-chain amino acid ABC transporter permease n=1 Tax=unclassified Oceanobacter TaxID=2620260 RepID=UPI0026E3CFB9|nr:MULTISPECIES: branched-chain amino acid ABC transporter permease [unclassified Oceanobacter]MDO6681403.1 branched-chain amino acid ABC transporter permease [Oceanobacter sp. 5_MG-2023]MDP2505112.1 branched-chain amino acid ABC transporter permease [Oceanobacter sp. 3_MG-2023]MDP2548236.1 branched-chain amino acid ABC transporter permease [Oceanobacter sp. 4_MG-2023]MDP2608158.1 branched-chain amino acid ABC transporter permease [Oceanobacter sp. 1_MG-2023]MDP2611180.1 branched-chain amino a
MNAVTQPRQRGLTLILILGLISVGLLAPLVVYPVFLMKFLCFALFACAFNLMLGFVGMLSFGHAAFLATGGYITGYAMTHFGLTPELGVLVGTLASAILGFVFGKLSVKREGIYFAMVTLALAQLVFFFYLQADFTGGENGMQGIPRGELFGLIDLNDNLNMYYFVLAVFLLGFFVVYRTVHSPFGQVLKAIRENEPRAVSLGYSVGNYKLLAFVISAALAGMAGSTKALVFELESLTDAHWHMSGEVVLMTLLGGMGTLFGPVVGAAIVIAISTLFSGGELGNYIHIIMGAIFVMCVLSFRRGVVGEFQRVMARNFSASRVGK